jgi:uncharacterized Zn-finger protein
VTLPNEKISNATTFLSSTRFQEDLGSKSESDAQDRIRFVCLGTLCNQTQTCKVDLEIAGLDCSTPKILLMHPHVNLPAVGFEVTAAPASAT